MPKQIFLAPSQLAPGDIILSGPQRNPTRREVRSVQNRQSSVFVTFKGHPPQEFNRLHAILAEIPEDDKRRG